MLCDYSHPYIVVKRRIIVAGANNDNRRIKKLTFKNNTLFRSHISKIINTFIENAEDLNLVMPMYNLLEYSGNYSMKSGSLCNYYQDEMNNDAKENNDAGNYGIRTTRQQQVNIFSIRQK